jgi:hypothetical protein
LNLLSFGEEAEEEEQQSKVTDVKMKSSYHFSDDPTERQTAEEVEKLKELEKQKKQDKKPETDTKKRTEESLRQAATGSLKKEATDADFATTMREKMQSKRRKFEETGTP